MRWKGQRFTVQLLVYNFLYFSKMVRNKSKYNAVNSFFCIESNMVNLSWSWLNPSKQIQCAKHIVNIISTYLIILEWKFKLNRKLQEQLSTTLWKTENRQRYICERVSQNRYQLPGEKNWTHKIEAKCARPIQVGVQTVKSHGIQNGYYFVYSTRIGSVLLHRMH